MIDSGVRDCLVTAVEGYISNQDAQEVCSSIMNLLQSNGWVITRIGRDPHISLALLQETVVDFQKLIDNLKVLHFDLSAEAPNGN